MATSVFHYREFFHILISNFKGVMTQTSDQKTRPRLSFEPK